MSADPVLEMCDDQMAFWRVNAPLGQTNSWRTAAALKVAWEALLGPDCHAPEAHDRILEIVRGGQ